MRKLRRVDSSDLVRTPRSVERLVSRIGASLSAPLGIMLIMPGLVSLVGTFLTLVGERALRNSNLAVAHDRMLEQASLVATSVRDALEQADPMLDRLADLTLRHDPTRPYETYAHALLDLMQGRHGVTYVSASFPDGTFQGAYLDVDGVVRFQDSRVRPDGTFVQRFDYGERDRLTLQRTQGSAYDPRIRTFYLQATSARRRIWTEPYLFYDSSTAGITRAAPVYRVLNGERVLHAVVTIDFDVHALSGYLRGRRLAGMRALLYTSDGTLLAHAADEGDTALVLTPQGARPLRLADVEDPLLRAFFRRAGGSGSAQTRYLTFRVRQERYLGAIARVTGDPELPWSMAYVVPERLFLRELHAYEDRSLLIAAAAVLVSTLLAYLFARHITRVREEAAEAKAEAREARELAREARAEARELGSYRLVACLGQGGMGEVWRAEHRLLAREAAIKLIKRDGSEAVTSALNERFRREAEALARLRSRNTIELFDYGVAADGTFFLVMELLDGLDLDSLVLQYGPQPPARVVHFLAQICSSLAEAHDAGLVHRDIKPANVFVCRVADELDVIKVLDFGLVRGSVDAPESALPQSVSPSGASVHLTHPHGMVGTPAFMAPEQVQSQALDGRADLYALGGVAFWLLTGELVFERDNPVDQLLAHAHDPLPPLRPRLPDAVPDELVGLITACLEKRPEARPSSARALGRALREITFPPDQCFPVEHAEQWWAAYRPSRVESLPALESRELAIGPTIHLTRE